MNPPFSHFKPNQFSKKGLCSKLRNFKTQQILSEHLPVVPSPIGSVELPKSVKINASFRQTNEMHMKEVTNRLVRQHFSVQITKKRANEFCLCSTPATFLLMETAVLRMHEKFALEGVRKQHLRCYSAFPEQRS